MTDIGLQLDAGLDERIMLVSRDDQSCLVVSYREIKACIEAAYRSAYRSSILAPPADTESHSELRNARGSVQR
jgi:hypothetical protein